VWPRERTEAFVHIHFIGVLVRLAYIGGGRRGTKKGNEGDAARKT
jgi:hypothetical protein